MSENIIELLEMFTYRRPHLGETVAEFVHDFILPIGATHCNKSGNYILDVPHTDGLPIVTLFSSHVDTVHREDGKQKIIYQPDFGHVSKEDGKPLGSDDATGCWLMLQMIRESVPGRYIFHVGEECGGIGSDDLVRYAPEWLDGISHAVAFDRRGTTDIITHQAGGRCCSDDFAKELALQMGMGYKPDDGGVFTDTANFTDLVKECTNLSVGYEAEHTGNETQDILHLENMLEALLKVDWSGLPAVRDETVVEYADYGMGDWYRQHKKGAGKYAGYGDYDQVTAANNNSDAELYAEDAVLSSLNDEIFLTTVLHDEIDNQCADYLVDETTLQDLCIYDAEVAAYLLYHYAGVTNTEVREALVEMNERNKRLKAV